MRFNIRKLAFQAGWFSGDPFVIAKIAIGEYIKNCLFLILSIQLLKFEITVTWDLW